jgi:hypothetical protein
MTIFDKLFKKKAQDNIGGVEDFMILIRVYYQATIASHIGINNLAALPDLRVFKQTYHVTTLNTNSDLQKKSNARRCCKAFITVATISLRK